RQEALAALPAVRQEHAVAALGDEIVVIGGFAPTVTATVLAYNSSTNSWRSIANFPSALHHANAAVVNGRLYVAGFYVGNSFTNTDGRVFVYDAQQNAWQAKTAMPAGTERAASCVAVLGTKIYLFGGARGGTLANASAYDVNADSWETLPDLPESREHCVAAALADKLYVASGRASGIGGFRPKTWQFDPVARSYTEKAAIPTPRGGTAGAVLGGRLVVFGGEGNGASASGVFPHIEAYSPESNAWQSLPDMLVPRHGFGAATLAQRIYLPGGATQQAFGAVNDSTAFWFE
ncbi:MAG TPA: kelch repeat-containing protein, partial [Polyangiaceae bacterium]|nr:kelch repeat-containing protein [Polyangiaceae bacterium]